MARRIDLRACRCAGLVLLALLLLAADARAAGCNADGWVGGQVDLCEGQLVYRDYVYDDFGADSGAFGTSPGRFAVPAGDDRNPVGAEGSTDLVDLTLKIDGDRLLATFELEAKYKADDAIAALAIDTDANESTGGGAWKDVLITSKGWDVQQSFKTGDPKTNVIEGNLPLPAGDRWRVQAVVARPDGRVMNVAFRGTSEKAAGTIATTRTGPIGAYFDDVQAAILKSGDISDTGYTVTVADMRTGVTRVAPLEPGFHSRVYVSDYTTGRGEGWSESTPVQGRTTEGAPYAQGFHYFGRYQPYGIYVPKQGGPHGLIVSMHSYSAIHTFLVNQPGFQRQLGDEINSVIVAPLGRGPAGYYSDISERDVLDVMLDVQAAYPIDADRVISAGYSMGGYGAFRMAMLHPDKFAGMISWVGGSGDASNTDVQSGTLLPAGAVGNVIDYTRSLLHVPSAMIYAAEDPLLHVHSAEAMRSRYSAGETPFEWFLHPAAEHTTFADLDEWGKEAAYVSRLRRVRHPVRVVFRTEATLGNEFYGIAHDRAYWVSQVRGRDKRFIDVDASALGCGGTEDVFATGHHTGETPVPWVSEFRERTGTKPVAAKDRFEGDLRNVRSFTVDTKATCLDGKTFTYKFKTDGPITIRFSDGRSIAVDSPGEYQGTSTPGSDA